jgi:hypothetical protein
MPLYQLSMLLYHTFSYWVKQLMDTYVLSCANFSEFEVLRPRIFSSLLCWDCTVCNEAVGVVTPISTSHIQFIPNKQEKAVSEVFVAFDFQDKFLCDLEALLFAIMTADYLPWMWCRILRWRNAPLCSTFILWTYTSPDYISERTLELSSLLTQQCPTERDSASTPLLACAASETRSLSLDSARDIDLSRPSRPSMSSRRPKRLPIWLWTQGPYADDQRDEGSQRYYFSLKVNN